MGCQRWLRASFYVRIDTNVREPDDRERVLSGPPDEHDRTEDRDQGSDRKGRAGPPATGDGEAYGDQASHKLGQCQNHQRPLPSEACAQHRHQLDVASADRSWRNHCDHEEHSSPDERTQHRVSDGRNAKGNGQDERVNQTGDRDEIGDNSGPQIKDYDQGKRDEQREQTVAPRRGPESPQGQ